MSAADDRLADIEGWARVEYDLWVEERTRDEREVTTVSASEAADVLALVKVARAARALTEEPFGSLIDRDFYRLREALAELEADK